MTSDAYRNAIALGCVLGGIWIHYSGTLIFTLGVLLWLLLAMGAGFMRPSARMLLVAPVPWIAGVGGGMLTGRHDSLGELWLLPLILSTLAGVIGIIFGVAARRGRHGRNTRESGAPDIR